MSKTFKAILIKDVHYRDFGGRLYAQPAGTEVIVTQLTGDGWLSMRSSGSIEAVVPDYLYASVGNINFKIDHLQFQALN